MELIQVSDNTLINPEHVSAVEIRQFRGKKTFVVFVGPHTFNVSITPQDFLGQLKRSGIGAYEQFFAG